MCTNCTHHFTIYTNNYKKKQKKRTTPMFINISMQLCNRKKYTALEVTVQTTLVCSKPSYSLSINYKSERAELNSNRKATTKRANTIIKNFNRKPICATVYKD